MRTWFILALIFFVTAVYAVTVMIHMYLWKNADLFFAYTRSWSKFVLKVSGVNVTMQGADALKPGDRYVYVANHASLFDIPVILAHVPDNVRIMYKRELERIPIFGWCVRMSPFIAIDRERGRDASDVLQSTVETLRTGSSILIFPEGTRSDEGHVGTFRRGAFTLAARSGRPIVALSLIGTSSILPKKTRHIKGGKVILKIEEPVLVSPELSREEERELMTKVRQIIANNVDSHI